MFAVLQSAYGLRGLRIKFKGKIGNKGSFRKKKIILRYGGIKKSNVLSRADEAFGLAKNFTGVIGITVTLAY